MGRDPTRFPCSRQGKAYTVPDQQVTLRLLNAIDKKRKQWEKSLASEIVSLQDLHIIAVNTALIDLAGLEITPPRIVKAVYGIGDQYVTVNLETKKVIGSGYHPRFAIPKASGKSVDSALFVSAAASDVSAVLYSRAGLFRTYSEHLTSTDVERLGRDFLTVHNINAAVALPEGWLRLGREVVRRGNDLEILSHVRKTSLS